MVYFLTFIDDYSRKSWVSIFKHTSITFGNFQKFKSMVENEYGKSINTLRIDNGGEFIKKEFNAYLSKHGIQHHKNLPYTPQQKRVYGRKNRTLVEMDRCMLYSKGLHKHFWTEAICYTNYIFNRVPIKTIL